MAAVHPADQWFCAAEARDGGEWNMVSMRTPAVTLRTFTVASRQWRQQRSSSRQHHGANTDVPAELLPQTTADCPTVYV